MTSELPKISSPDIPSDNPISNLQFKNWYLKIPAR
jgi:hypothetical protein